MFSGSCSLLTIDVLCVFIALLMGVGIACFSMCIHAQQDKHLPTAPHSPAYVLQRSECSSSSDLDSGKHAKQ